MRYLYLLVHQDRVQHELDEHSRTGWTLLFLNRNPGASVVDIIFQKDSQ